MQRNGYSSDSDTDDPVKAVLNKAKTDSRNFYEDALKKFLTPDKVWEQVQDKHDKLEEETLELFERLMKEEGIESEDEVDILSLSLQSILWKLVSEFLPHLIRPSVPPTSSYPELEIEETRIIKNYVVEVQHVDELGDEDGMTVYSWSTLEFDQTQEIKSEDEAERLEDPRRSKL